MTRLMMISLILLLIGAALWLGYASQGASIDADGVLHEPFPLLALGWLFMLTGGIALLVGMARTIIKRKARRS